MPHRTRRQLLATTAVIGISVIAGPPARARIISGALPWSPNQVYPPTAVLPGPWQFFTADEAAVVEAIADRIIPADELGPGGREAGCAVFIDRQLVGPYGSSEWLYMEAPFVGRPGQFRHPITRHANPALPRRPRGVGRPHQAGLRRPAVPSARCRRSGSRADRSGEGRDQIPEGKAFFNQMQTNVVEGYFADPVYGGNKDMCGWKLVGFPGTRYDYRDVIANPNKPYTSRRMPATTRPEPSARSATGRWTPSRSSISSPMPRWYSCDAGSALPYC